MRFVLPTLLALAAAGCSWTSTRVHLASGAVPLCSKERDLGAIAVVPGTAWRADQKDVAERVAMAERAIEQGFDRASCSERVEVRAMADWAARPEQERLDEVDREGVDTAIFLSVEELGPTLAVTFSVPLLWIGTSEAQVRLRALHVPTGEVLLDAAVEQSRGGPFQLRPASWAESELTTALAALLGSEP